MNTDHGTAHNMTMNLRDMASARLRGSQTTGPILLAVTIGMGAGLTAVALRIAIENVQWLFQDVLGGWLSGWLGYAWTIPVIALGGILVGVISTYLAPETKGHGIPEVMYAVARLGGRIRARVALVKIVASAITIGSGGSAGREGPIVHIGSALGSSLAQWLRLSDRMITLAVACGAAGGVAATFNAPMAGVIFALEVIVRRFTVHYFGLVVISSAAALMVVRWLSGVGDYPKFEIMQNYSLTSVWDLFFFMVLGILAALMAHVFIRFLYRVEDITEKTPIPAAVKPAIGGALLGVLAMYTPHVMGSGYGTVEAALNNNLLGATLLLLCFAKIVGTVLTVGTGGSGGIFLPSLYTGAMLGGAYGKFLNRWVPEIVSSPGAYSLVGMAAFFAAAAHAPITSILVLIEMTDNYYIILPLMSATVMSTFVSRRISKDSIYTIKLTQRGIHISDSPEANLMDAVTVAEAMDRHVDSVSPDMPVAELIDAMRASRENGFLVLDDKQELLGIVTAHDIEAAILHRPTSEMLVKDIYTRNVVVCRPEQSLSSALTHFGAHSYGRLPVIDPNHPGRVIGVLRRQNIITACVNAQLRSDEMLARVDQYQDLSRRSAMVIETATVTSRAPLAGTHVRDAAFPAEATLGAIRRGNNTLVPRGSTLIQPGDELVLLTTQDHLDGVRQWLQERT